MLPIEFDALTFIKANQPHLWSDVLNHFRDTYDINDMHRALLHLESVQGLIEKTSVTGKPPECMVRMSIAGNHALSCAQQAEQEKDQARTEQESNQTRERRFHTKQTVLGAVVGSVLTLAVEIIIYLLH